MENISDKLNILRSRFEDIFLGKKKEIRYNFRKYFKILFHKIKDIGRKKTKVIIVVKKVHFFLYVTEYFKRIFESICTYESKAGL